ncbi:hypothetical protein VFPBJ_09414 [Purpureocillium lilacinum]|uniref:Uncharacterized protein n=1 Tax=Purpureocillium lilacinum TaxID=33203 RepID=A0A179GDJ0_PURLI|nr:hypothetical protein VFPBJ_09414 [Purpureocillium lilacinum]
MRHCNLRYLPCAGGAVGGDSAFVTRRLVGCTWYLADSSGTVPAVPRVAELAGEVLGPPPAPEPTHGRPPGVGGGRAGATLGRPGALALPRPGNAQRRFTWTVGGPASAPVDTAPSKREKREPRRAPAAQAPSLVSPVVSRVVRDVLLHFFRPRSLPGSCGLVLAPAARAARKLINKIIAQSACAPRANLSLLSFSPPSPASQPLYGPHKVKIPALTVPRLSRAAHDTCLRLPRAPAIRCPASAPGLCVGLPAVGAGSARHARGPSSLPPPRPVQLKGLSFSFWASALELSCAASRPADGNVVTMAIGSRGLGSANWHSRRLVIIRGLVPPDSDDFIVRVS